MSSCHYSALSTYYRITPYLTGAQQLLRWATVPEQWVEKGRGLPAVPLSVGELDPHLTQCRLGRDLYLRNKWHPDPSSRLAKIDMGRGFSGLGRGLPPYQVAS